jgi:hypothetical protein
MLGVTVNDARIDASFTGRKYVPVKTTSGGYVVIARRAIELLSPRGTRLGDRA